MKLHFFLFVTDYDIESLYHVQRKFWIAQATDSNEDFWNIYQGLLSQNQKSILSRKEENSKIECRKTGFKVRVKNCDIGKSERLSV